MTSSREIDAALIAVVSGGEVAAARPVLDAILDKLEHAVLRRVFQKLNSGETLDPQFAVQSWMELFTYSRTRSHLTKTIDGAQSAGATLQEHMDNGE